MTHETSCTISTYVICFSNLRKVVSEMTNLRKVVSEMTNYLRKVVSEMTHHLRDDASSLEPEILFPSA
jgi:hypothetical protein